jgi:hypothetical protein
MGDAEEFSGQRPDRIRMLPTYRRPGSRSGRIRYAHGGGLPRIEPFCTVPQGTGPQGTGPQGTMPQETGPQGTGEHRGGDGDAGGGTGDGAGGAGGGYGVGAGGGDFPGTGLWAATEFPATGRPTDLWVLVCGAIAAAAAFAAAFVASGGVSSHPAAPVTQPAVMSQACPSPVSGRTP